MLLSWKLGQGKCLCGEAWEKVPRERWSEGVVGGVKILIGRKVRIRAGNCSTAHDWRNGPCARGRCQKAAKSCQSEHHAILKVIPTKKKSCPAKKWWQLKVHAPTGVRGAGGQLGKREISWKCGELLLLRVWRLTITDRGHVGSWWHWLSTVFLSIVANATFVGSAASVGRRRCSPTRWCYCRPWCSVVLGRGTRELWNWSCPSWPKTKPTSSRATATALTSIEEFNTRAVIHFYRKSQ